MRENQPKKPLLMVSVQSRFWNMDYSLGFKSIFFCLWRLPANGIFFRIKKGKNRIA